VLPCSNSIKPTGKRILNMVKEVNFRGLYSALKQKKSSKNACVRSIEESAEAVRMWEVMRECVRKGSFRLSDIELKSYIDVPDSNSRYLVEFCADFIDQIVNEDYFFDSINKIAHENQLRAKFKASARFYWNKPYGTKNTNILVEMKSVIRQAKHSKYCLERHERGERCSCEGDSLEKLLSLMQKDSISEVRYDPGSKYEAEELREFLRQSFSKKYPELLI